MPKPDQLIQLVKIPKIFDDCYLYFAQTPDHIPFKIKRVYYIANANPKLPRGLHAHRKTRQIIFCIQGSIKLLLDNGKKKEEILLNKPNIGVVLENMIWHQMHDFRSNTILLVLASAEFSEKDYIRDYEQFKKQVHQIS